MDQQFVKNVFKQIIIPFVLGAFYLNLSGYRSESVFNLYNIFLFSLILMFVLPNNYFGNSNPSFTIILTFISLFYHIYRTSEADRYAFVHNIGYVFILAGIFYLLNYDDPLIVDKFSFVTYIPSGILAITKS